MQQRDTNANAPPTCFEIANGLEVANSRKKVGKQKKRKPFETMKSFFPV